MTIDIDKIKNLYSKFQNNLVQYNKMEDYYNGKTDILTTYKKSQIGCNRKVNVNFVKKLVDEEVSFSVGNPITYVPSLTDKEILEGKTVQESVKESNIVNSIMKKNPNCDSILETNMLKFGEAMEEYYWKDGKFKIKEYSPLNMITERDEEDNVISALKIFTLNNEQYMDYFTKDEVIRLDNTFKVIKSNTSDTKHNFGFCPIGYASQIGGSFNTIYNDIKSVQDTIECIISDLSNEIGDSRLSYLILKNMTFPKEIKEKYIDKKTDKLNENKMMQDLIKNMRDNAIISLDNDNKDGEVGLDYLIKNINADMHMKALEFLLDIIYQISQHINLNEQQASNTSGVALQTRIIALRNKVKMQQNCLTKIIRTRIKAIITMMRINYGFKDLDEDKVDIVYNINIPSDNAAIADIMTKLCTPGYLDVETGLSQLSFITNPKEIYEKAQEEFKARLKGEQQAKESMIGGLNEAI